MFAVGGTPPAVGAMDEGGGALLFLWQPVTAGLRYDWRSFLALPNLPNLGQEPEAMDRDFLKTWGVSLSLTDNSFILDGTSPKAALGEICSQGLVLLFVLLLGLGQTGLLVSELQLAGALTSM